MYRDMNAPKGPGLEALQVLQTGFARHDGAVSVYDDTTPQFLVSHLKAGIVTVLGWILAWRPGLAIILGRLVLQVWPNFRRA